MKNGCLAKEMCSDGSLYSIDPLLLLLFRPFIDFLGGGISADCCNSTPRVGFCLVLFFNPAQQPTVGQLLQMLRERGRRPSILLEYASWCFQALREISRRCQQRWDDVKLQQKYAFQTKKTVRDDDEQCFYCSS